MIYSDKRGFSLVELVISIVAISCITAAFAPVITKRIKNQNATRHSITINTSSKAQDLSAILNVLKDCKLNNSKTALICEIELSKAGLDDENIKKELSKNIEQQKPKSIKTTEVKYSERRDKIRFDDREQGGYQTTTTTIIKNKDNKDNKDSNSKKEDEDILEGYSNEDLKQAVEMLKTLYIPIDGDDLLFDKLELK